MNPPDRLDDWINAGLYDPNAGDADQRIELLTWLDARGIGLADMDAAELAGQLSAVAGDRHLRCSERISLRQVAALVGMPIEFALQLQRATDMAPGSAGAGDIDRPNYVADDESVFRLSTSQARSSATTSCCTSRGS